MQGQHDEHSCLCEQAARPVRASTGDPSTCNVHAHATPELRPNQQRTNASLRAEQAYRDWTQAPPSERPLAAHRLTVASILFQVLAKCEVSNRRFAEMIEVDDKTVAKWLDGRAPVPAAVVLALPTDMALDFLARLAALRGSRSGLDHEIAKLRTHDEVRAAQRALLARDDQIAGGR